MHSGLRVFLAVWQGQSHEAVPRKQAVQTQQMEQTVQRGEGWTGVARKISLGMNRTRSIVKGTLYEKDTQQQWVNQERHKFSREFPKESTSLGRCSSGGDLGLGCGFCLCSSLIRGMGPKESFKGFHPFQERFKVPKTGHTQFCIGFGHAVLKNIL